MRWPAATGGRSTPTSGCAGGAAPEDAQDLTQEFFTRAFEREYLSRYDPAKARFRTFVRTCLDGFLANEDKAAGRLKRGGGFTITGVDFARFDADLAAHARSDEPDPERWFHREWIRGLFADAVERLRTHCDAAGHGRAFTLFLRYDIDEPDARRAPHLRRRWRSETGTARHRRHQRARLGAPRLPRHRPRRCCATSAPATTSSAPRRATCSESIRHDR